MKISRAARLVILLLCGIGVRLYSNASSFKPIIVKVLIEDHDRSKKRGCPSWTVTSEKGFHIYNGQTHASSSSDSQKTTLTISHHPSHIRINGVAYRGTHLRIIPHDGYATINGTQFHGSFSLVQQNNHTYLINHVDLEEYVCSVLKTESWPGWPVEVNKAFAISSRSYVVAMMQQMRNSKLPYHVKNTNEHQTYRGMHTTHPIRRAVELTKGMVLTYNNHIALTMFDSCCGGIIPAHITDFDFAKAPYLARTYPCTHCQRCKIFSWEKEIHLADINRHMAHLIEHPGVIQHITITEKDAADLVTKVSIKKGNKTHELSGKQLYSALPLIKSYCFGIERKANKLIFNGRGYGHHLGICQWGAREMVRDGWHYQRILSFYYPGTKIKKIC